ncbi:dolichol phosphate-mannose biosynthesis regulatory protein [Phlebotomus argentipes]|uniref:dolichol phosphate-mannose biosynthesis regulatory protein n=1 Tax=Phlebotomus argentipes TaxID=94469 RepID=UPI002892E91B|nr:dolichol phosphate-mannose biosynthesis regulatory protein [Phlebotomus argentipes]
MRDSIIGKIVLTLTLLAFIYYVSWLVLPFIQVEGDWIQSLFLPVEFAFMFPAIFGICFLGALALFTLYRVQEHVRIF